MNILLQALEKSPEYQQLLDAISRGSVAAVSGLVAIKTMIKIVSDKKLSYFSYYVWVLGVIVVLYGLFAPMLSKAA